MKIACPFKYLCIGLALYWAFPLGYVTVLFHASWPLSLTSRISNNYPVPQNTILMEFEMP